MSEPTSDQPGDRRPAEPSPWANPDSPVDWSTPSGDPVNPPPASTDPRRVHPAHAPAAGGGGHAAGSSAPPPYPDRHRGASFEPHAPLDASKLRNRILAGIGVTVVSLGVVVALIFLSVSGSPTTGSSSGGDAVGDGQATPRLAKLCPAPSASSSQGPAPAQPAPDGARTSDKKSGISYSQLGDPFHPWDLGTWSQGELGVKFNVGYYFVTEHYARGDYLASVLSGSVPATVGDSLTLNLACAGRQVADDVRNAYYPQPNNKEVKRDEYTVIGGRPAWVSEFHLTFSESGLSARGEMVAVVTVDVGRPNAAVLYISIPDTHQQYDSQIDPLIDSIRPTT